MSDNSDDDIEEDEENETLHSVKRYALLLCRFVMSKFIFQMALVREI